MRSAFRSPGVPSTREAGTASLVGGPSNRPMRAGFAESNFLIMAVPSTVLFTFHSVEKEGSLDCLPSSLYLPRGRTLVTDGLHDLSHLHRIARRDFLERYRQLIGRDTGEVLEHRPQLLQHLGLFGVGMAATKYAVQCCGGSLFTGRKS